MNWQIPLADLDYGPAEEAAVQRVLRGKWLTMGAETREFETRFAETIGANHAVAVSNATVALHLACLALGIGPGDEVIVPSLTFVATANAVRYTGAEVRFAEIHGPDDLTISPRAIESQITPATKAIMVMHYAGYPCAMQAVMALAHRHQLAVIEDAAHSPGAFLEGKALGTWGDVGCFSFFSNKNLSTGEGGMLVTQRDEIAEKARLLRSHGMTTLTWDRHQGHAYSYDVVALGYNYRMDEIRAALGLVQLGKLLANNARRGELTERYWQGLEASGVGLPFRDSLGTPAYHIFPILLPDGVDRYSFIDHMRAAGIQTSIHYPPIHQFQAYQTQYADVKLPVTEHVAQREVTLPLYATMTEAQVDQVIDAVKRGLQ
ncbi:MAG: DegT/DnrJ/EryC1/StrS family aminotransferase [Anaerolineales bacterium]|nr:DegT/DnrJ/EryC1/StrS family aminotransferase [Anaerolineales bacterium]